jgi:hypothetical protein
LDFIGGSPSSSSGLGAEVKPCVLGDREPGASPPIPVFVFRFFIIPLPPTVILMVLRLTGLIEDYILKRLRNSKIASSARLGKTAAFAKTPISIGFSWHIGSDEVAGLRPMPYRASTRIL